MCHCLSYGGRNNLQTVPVVEMKCLLETIHWINLIERLSPLIYVLRANNNHAEPSPNQPTPQPLGGRNLLAPLLLEDKRNGRGHIETELHRAAPHSHLLIRMLNYLQTMKLRVNTISFQSFHTLQDICTNLQVIQDDLTTANVVLAFLGDCTV